VVGLDAAVSLLLLSMALGQAMEEAHLQNGRMFFLGCFCINTVFVYTSSSEVSISYFQGR